MTEDRELENSLWATADKLRSNMDPSEYKHVFLGLIGFISIKKNLKGIGYEV